MMWQMRVMIMGLVLGLSGCSALSSSTTPPEWVEKGSGVLSKNDPKSLYGVGTVTGIRNVGLAWETAENRARAELVRTISTSMGYLMRDYAASVSQLEGRTVDEQSIERGIRTFSSMTLNGVRIYDRHMDPTTHSYSVTVRLNLDEFQQTLQEMKQLNPKVREYIQKNAEKMFERLDQEEAKRGQP